MLSIPVLASLDSSLALLADPYRFISSQCEQLDTDIFETRLLFERTICVRGEPWARLFYESPHLTRQGAVPKLVQQVLFGKGGVQGLEGAPHRRRKALLMSIMAPDRIAELVKHVGEVFDRYAWRWAMQGKVVLYDELRLLLTEAVCHWAGVGLATEEVERRGRDLAAMYEESATIGLGQFRGRAARRACEEWVGSQLAEIRAGRREVCPRSAAHMLATGEEADGTLIDLQGATVDLLSVLRPTVAVSLFLTFAAHALDKFPATRERLVGGDSQALQSFAQEVRRFYPFFPLTAAIVAEPLDYRGYHLPRGRRMLMDLYGTNHDPKLWNEPNEFRPERFDNWKPNANTLVPQGGGNQETNHRCVGEALTIELLKLFADRLVNDMRYTVPEQNLEPDMRRAPALIPSGFEIAEVQLTGMPNLANDDSSATAVAYR